MYMFMFMCVGVSITPINTRLPTLDTIPQELSTLFSENRPRASQLCWAARAVSPRDPPDSASPRLSMANHRSQGLNRGPHACPLSCHNSEHMCMIHRYVCIHVCALLFTCIIFRQGLLLNKEFLDQTNPAGQWVLCLPSVKIIDMQPNWPLYR